VSDHDATRRDEPGDGSRPGARGEPADREQPWDGAGTRERGRGAFGGRGDADLTAIDLSSQLDDLLDRGRTGEVDPEDVQRGLASLVLTLVEVLRELMERQALRRMDSGTLTDDEVERLGRTFLALRDRMDELKETFGLTDEDLNIDLGPLGRLR
jgi:hypothetical protein